MTIEQTVDIPADRRLHLDVALPQSLAPGTAELKITIKPAGRRTFITSLGGLYGCLKDDSAFAGTPEEIQRNIREDVWKDSI